MECVVEGIIETQYVEALEILLQGLCGVHRDRLRTHELCLKSVPNLGLVSSEIRLLCDLEQSEPTWTVRHIGGAMKGPGAEQISVLVKSKIIVAVSSINKMLKLHATDETVPLTPGIQIVEVSAPASSENYTEVAAVVSSFCEYLAPPGIGCESCFFDVAHCLAHVLNLAASLSKPGGITGVVPTAAEDAASLMSDGGGTTL